MTSFFEPREDSLTLLSLLAQFPLSKVPYSLGPIKRLLERLGDPQKRIPPVIHVTGTNGKGSSCAFLASCFTAAGLRVHRYTSPHIFSYTERIRVRGCPISEELLCDFLRTCQKYSDGDVSPFEALTVSAFLAFSESNADVAIIEVGMGGDLDATNTVETTHVAVVTPISYDHMEVLGSSLTQIARHKAGIMRQGVPCVIGPQKAHVMRALESAAPVKTPLYRFGREWLARRWKDPGFYFWWHKKRTHYDQPGLVGDHQAVNAGVALATLEVQTLCRPTKAQIEEGLQRTVWPGRLEPLAPGCVRDLFPEGCEVWIDGAHNVGGAHVLRHHIMRYWQDRPLILAIGMLKTKDSNAFWQILAPLAEACFISEDFDEKALPFSCFEDYGRTTGTPVYPWTEIGQMAVGDTKPRILFCGSLYFIAQVLVQNEKGRAKR